MEELVSEERKKILVITPRFPYPVVGGDRLRIFQICKYLSKFYELTLISLCESKSELYMDVSCDVFKSVERFYLPKWRSYINTILALPTRLPLQIAYYKCPSFSKRIASLSISSDAIFAHLIRAGHYVKDVNAIKFLEMTDAISLNYSRINFFSNNFFDIRSIIYSIESHRLANYERRIPKFFNHCFLVSDVDRNYLYPIDSTSRSTVSVVSNGVDLDAFPFQFQESATDIIFIGNMHSLQNLDAATFLVKEIFPYVRAVMPQVTCKLIGRIREIDAKALAMNDGVVVTGEVEIVSEAAIGGGVGICPIRLGAGVQNKVLEYMSLGLPTVSTDLGLEGFHARPEYELLIANDAVALSNAILRLLRERSFALKIARMARLYVEQNHSWDAQLKSLHEQIKKQFASD